MSEQTLPQFRAAVASATGRPGAREVWRGLGAAGVISALYRPGTGDEVDPVRLGVLFDELDRDLPVGAVLSICVQVALAVPLLAAAARGGGRAADVHAAARRGEAVVALAATDSGAAGSDLMDARTTAHITGDTVVVDGGKDWITNAVGYDYALVLARHRPARHFTSFCWVLVPAGEPGVTVVPAGGALFDGAGLGHLRLRACTVPHGNLAGPPGRALAAFARQIGTERLAGALWARAMCRRLLTGTRDWLARRPLGGGVQWDNAAIRERFAHCLVELARIDALCAAQRPGPVAPATGMVLKAAVARSVERILAECASLRGADAFRDGGEAGLRAAAAMFGTAGGATGAMLAGIADQAHELLRAAP